MRSRRIRGKEEAAAEIDQRKKRQRKRENESGDHPITVNDGGPAEAGPHDRFSFASYVGSGFSRTYMTIVFAAAW